MKKSNKKPLISVIIPTHNSQKSIKQCLDSIKKQTYKRIEILVVDGYSVDETVQIARRFKAKVFLLDSERSGAKNHAAKKAIGEFLLFIDSDMKLNPKIVEESVKRCTENEAQAVIIPEEYLSFGLVGESRKTEKEILSNLNELMEIPRFFRKDVFLKLEGFDEKLVCGEDFHLFQKFRAAGYKVVRIEAKILHFENVSSFFNVVTKAYNYGKTVPHLIEKAPSNAVKRYANIRLVSVQKIGTNIRDLKILAIFLMMKVLEFLAYFLGIWTGMANSFFTKIGFGKIAAEIRERRHTVMALAFFILIAVTIFRNFLFTNEFPAGNDVFGWISREYIFSRDYRWLYIWRPYSFGFVEGVNLIDLFFMMMNLLFVDANLTIKIFLFFSFLLAGFSIYALTYSYTRNNVGALSATLVYTLNQWFFSQITEGHVDIIFSYAFAPLLFLLVDRALRKGRVKDIMFSVMGLMVFLAGFHANCFVIYGVFLTLFLILYLIFPDCDVKFTARSKNLLKLLTICVIAVFLLTSFFTIPFVSNIRAHFLSEEYKYPIEESIYFSASNLTDAFTLGATEEGGYIAVVDVRRGFGLPDFPVQTFLFFIFLISYSAILVRRDRYTIFFLITSIVSVFISKGPNPPVGDFFIWAWFNIPYFAVFRRPNRWEMMTALSNAFFVALFVSLLSNYIIKEPATSKETSFCIRVENAKHTRVKELYVSINILSKWARAFQRVFRFLVITFMILVFLSGLISGWFFFHNGLLTYKIPKNYVKSFQWIAEQPGQYKIITTNKSPGEWANDPNAGTDFAFCRMLTEIGWVHDIGFDSSLFHNKPVLQDGGWEPTSKAFVDYLRSRLVFNNMTDDFLKILGLFNYRYVIVPPYVSERVKEFFLNQEGGCIAYNESDSIIVENSFFTQQFFSPKNYVIVVGGLEAFPSLCKIDSFALNETAFLFLNPKNTEHSFFKEKFGFSKAIVFTSGTSILDAAISILGDDASFSLAKNYAVPSTDVTKYWVSTSFWRDLGKLVFGGDTLTTRGKCKAEIPFTVRSDGEYEVWIRTAFGPDRGKLSLYADDEFLTELIPKADYWITLKWVKITTLNIKNGHHILTLHNDGSGYNDVDAICIAEKSAFQAKLDEFLETLQSFKGRIIYMLQPEDFFEKSVIPKWMISSHAYEGNVLVGEDALINISPEGNASASSTQILSNLEHEAKYAADANLTTRWASSPTEGPPQWLQVNWTDSQEIVAIKVVFETAYAEDYLIQAWDDEKSDWLTLINATGINSTACLRIDHRISCLHFFEKPVNTKKLRIYVTAFSEWPMVSVWELEAYKIATSTELSIPSNGNYQCFIRANPMSENGKIYLKLGEKTSTISLLNSSNKYQWLEAGTFHLNVGEQKLSIGAFGKVGIGQTLLCSLSENESSPNLSELFAGEMNIPVIEYQRVNPCTYKLQVTASEPFLLVLSESHNHLWKALVEGEEISPVPVYSIINGFFINKTGNLTITIYFTGQTYVDVGLKIGLSSFLFTVAIILIPSKVSGKLISKVKAIKRG